MKENQKSKDSWWQTIPGILTAGGIAIATLIAITVSLYQAGVLDGSDKDNKVKAIPTASVPIDNSTQSRKESPITPVSPIIAIINKTGGLPGTQSSPPLDEEVDFETTGDLKIKFEFNRKICSKIRLHLSIDGKLIKATDFFDETTGMLDLGRISPGSHTLELSPEGRVGGCNTGHLKSWGGKLTLYVSREAH